MTTHDWGGFADEAPEPAAFARARLDAHPHELLATLRADGSPRLSGVEVSILDGVLWLGGMAGSLTFRDLRRDPRCALHSGSDDPPDRAGDAKLAGTAVEVTDPEGLAAFAEAVGGVPPGPFELSRLQVAEVSTVRLAEGGRSLATDAWRPGSPVRRSERT